jgi:hypothetical protein
MLLKYIVQGRKLPIHNRNSSFGRQIDGEHRTRVKPSRCRYVLDLTTAVHARSSIRPYD